MRKAATVIAMFSHLIIAATAVADPPLPGTAASQVATIKKLIPAGQVLARSYDGNTKVLLTGDTYLDAVSNSFVFADFNHDGVIDLAVATEVPPEASDGQAVGGDRRLLIYFGTKGGSFKLVDEGDKVVMSASDGGAFGDPFNGMSTNSKDSIVLDFYGGSSDRWGYTETFGFRGNAFYLIGFKSADTNSLSLKGQIVDTNLITGAQTTTTMRGANKKNVVTHEHVPIKPLVLLKDTDMMGV
jgi:hypothetical protein